MDKKIKIEKETIRYCWLYKYVHKYIVLPQIMATLIWKLLCSQNWAVLKKSHIVFREIFRYSFNMSLILANIVSLCKTVQLKFQLQLVLIFI